MRAARAARSALRRAAPATLIARRSLFVELERDVVRPAALAAYKARVAAHGAARGALDEGYRAGARRGLRAPLDGVDATETSVFAEATATLAGAGLPGLAGGAVVDAAPGAVYELRTYELVLGYATVPRFLELYAAGLADKLAVDDTGESTLVSLLHSEAGVAPLNTVIELWRHDSAQGSMRSRVKSREATTRRAAIGDIAAISTRFETQLLAPLYA
ncbi:3'-tRNA processing endoribonuclease [Aureococcus anophagefferens]|nr:3'-tRNA processing endoribonuclease [Aureococcus anophagefferens]